jgi:hypothetical protein
MFLPKPVIAGLLALTVAGTTMVAVPAEAEAHPLFWAGVAAGAAGGLIGSALFHPYHRAPVVIAPVAGHRCVIEQRVGRWGHIRDVEVCR